MQPSVAAAAREMEASLQERIRSLITHFGKEPTIPEAAELIRLLMLLVAMDPTTSVVVNGRECTVATVVSRMEDTKQHPDIALSAAERDMPALLETLSPSKQLEACAEMRLERKWVGSIALDGERLFLRDTSPPSSPPTEVPQSGNESKDETCAPPTDDSRPNPRRVTLFYGESGIGKTFRMVSSIVETEIGLFLSLTEIDKGSTIYNLKGDVDNAPPETISSCVMGLMIDVYQKFKVDAAFEATQVVLGIDECGASTNFVRAIIRHCAAIEQAVKKRWKFASFRFVLAGTGVESPTNRAGSDLSYYTAILVSRPNAHDMNLFKRAVRHYFRTVIDRYALTHPKPDRAVEMVEDLFQKLVTYPEIHKSVTNGRLCRLLAHAIACIPFELWKSHALSTHVYGAIGVASCQYRRENGLSGKSASELASLSLDVLNVLVTDTCALKKAVLLCQSGVLTDSACFVLASGFNKDTMIEVALPVDVRSEGQTLAYSRGTKRFSVTPAMRFMIISRFGLARLGTGDEFEDTMMAFVEMTALVYAGQSLKSLVLGLHNDTTIDCVDVSIGHGCANGYLEMETPKASFQRGSDVLPPDAQPLHIRNALPFLVCRLPKPVAGFRSTPQHVTSIPAEVKLWLQRAGPGDHLLMRNGPKSSYADIILFIKGMHMFLFQCKNCQADMTQGQVSLELRKMGHPQYHDATAEGEADDDDEAPSGHKLTHELQGLCGVEEAHVTYCFLLNVPSKLRTGYAPGIGTKLIPGTRHVIAKYIFADELSMIVEKPEENMRAMSMTAHDRDGTDPSPTKKLRAETK